MPSFQLPGGASVGPTKGKKTNNVVVEGEWLLFLLRNYTVSLSLTVGFGTGFCLFRLSPMNNEQ